MDTANSDTKPKSQRWGCGGCLLRGGLVLLVILVVGGGFSGIFLAVQQYRHRQTLAQEIQHVRDKGEPLGGAELNAWYGVPAGEKDITDAYLSALAPILPTDSRPDPLEMEKVGLAVFDEFPPHSPGGWQELESTESFLKQHSETLSLLHIAAAQEGAVRYPADFRDHIKTKLAYTQACRYAARLLRLEAICYAHRGQHDRAADSVFAMLRLAETLRKEPCLVSQLVRQAVWSIAGATLVYLAFDPSFGDEQLARLQLEIDRADCSEACYTAALGERAILFELMQQEKQPVGYGLLSERPIIGTRPGDCADLLKLMTLAVEGAAPAFPQKVETMKNALSTLEAKMATENARYSWQQNSLLLLVPAYHGAYRFCTDLECSRRAMFAMCAVERFRRRSGGLPEALEDLVPEYLAAIPEDPCDGKALRYVRREDGYSVYSVAINQTDDGGLVWDKVIREDIREGRSKLATDAGFDVLLTEPVKELPE